MASSKCKDILMLDGRELSVVYKCEWENNDPLVDLVSVRDMDELRENICKNLLNQLSNSDEDKIIKMLESSQRDLRSELAEQAMEGRDR